MCMAPSPDEIIDDGECEWAGADGLPLSVPLDDERVGIHGALELLFDSAPGHGGSKVYSLAPVSWIFCSLP